MEFAAQQPVDYSSAIAAGQGLAFNPLEAQLNAAKVGLAQSATQGQEIQNQAAAQALRMQQLELQRRVQFGQDMQGFVRQPTAEGLASLVGKYPEFASESENAWGTLDTAERRSTATQLGSVAALVAKGDMDSATKLVQDRIAADQTAGRDSSVPQQLLGLLQSGDPAKQRSVIAVASLLAGSAVGFDKAGEFLKGIGLSQEPVKTAPGEKLNNPVTGETIVANAPNLTAVTVTNADGSQTAAPFNPQTGAFGAAAVNGAPAAATGAPAAAASDGGGFQPAVSRVLSNEGGYNPSDMNGSPTMMGINYKANAARLKAMGITPANFRNMTADQATQIYQDYWAKSGAEKLAPNLQTPYFDVYVRNPGLAKSALTQSGGDPAKFMQIASGYFQKLATTPKGQKYAQAWANRDAINAQLASGSAAPGGATAASTAAAAPASGVAQAAASPYSFGGSPQGSLNTHGAPEGFAWNQAHTGFIPVPGGPQDANNDPQEVEDLARNWITQGNDAFAGLGGGMGGGGAQFAAIKKAAISLATNRLMPALGITSDDLPAYRSRYAADKANYTTISGVASSLQGSENALKGAAQQVLQTQAPLIQLGIIKDGVPNWLNTGALEANQHLASGPGGDKARGAIKAYRDAVNAFSQEYSKFMTAANGVGGSAAPSDSAREAAAELNDESMGPTALKQHMAQVLKEAEVRRTGFVQQQQALEHKLGSYLTPKGGAVHVNGLRDYNALPRGAHYIDPLGVARIKQ